jgi:hypothetical protein
VGETVVDEDTARQREYLGLVLKTTEGGGEYQTVIVALELCTVVVTLRMTVLLAQTLVGY